MSGVLPYRVVEDCSTIGDDDGLLQYQTIIIGCALGHSTPDTTASQLTKLVAERAWQRKKTIDLIQHEGPYCVESDLVAAVVGSLASSFPPSHAAQTRLINIFEALPLVSRHSTCRIRSSTAMETFALCTKVQNVYWTLDLVLYSGKIYHCCIWTPISRG